MKGGKSLNKIVLTNVCKILSRKKVLNDICLELKKGLVYGFVGENGSGKTMLFRAISGLMKIDSGTIVADDKELHKDCSVFDNVGIVLENAGLYPEFSGFQNLKFLSQINKKIEDDDIRYAIRRVGLDPYDKRPVRKYSLGMKQRIVLAQAIMEKPDILLLDEPTNALDEHGIQMFRALIEEEKKRDIIILLSSHNKEDIELLCDVVYRIKDGRID